MPAVAGTQLGALARAVAQEVGQAILGAPVTSSSAGASTLVLGSLLDAEGPPERYGGWYASLRTGSYAGQQVRVARAGYAGSTGTLTLATPVNVFGSVPVGVGVLVDLLGTIPMIDQDGLTGLVTCINRAARKLWTRYRWPIVSASPSVTEYDLGALWFASRDRFVGLLAPATGAASHPAPAAMSWNVAQSGETWTLELGSGFPAGQTFWLEVDIPLNFRLCSGGVWANQASPTAGMALDQDACLGPWNALLQCALYEAFRALAVQAGGGRKSYWAGRVGEQRAVVAALKAYQLDADDGEILGGGMGVGPGALRQDKGLFSSGAA